MMQTPSIPKQLQATNPLHRFTNQHFSYKLNRYKRISPVLSYLFLSVHDPFTNMKES